MQREIPRQQWSEFFEAFSRTHQGWLTSIEEGRGDDREQLPLDGVAVTLDGEDETITVTRSDPKVPQGHEQRAVFCPHRLIIEEEREQIDLRLETRYGAVRIRVMPTPNIRHAV